MQSEAWSIVVDIFENFEQYTGTKLKRSSVLYRGAIQVVLNNSKGNTLNTVIKLLNEAHQGEAELAKFDADMMHTQALLKDGNYESAYAYFHNNVVQEQVVEYQR